VCDSTIPVICLHDLLVDDHTGSNPGNGSSGVAVNDLSIFSKFLVSMSRFGRGHCVINLGKQVGLCSIHGFPINKKKTEEEAKTSEQTQPVTSTTAVAQHTMQEVVKVPSLPQAQTPPRSNMNVSPIKHSSSFSSIGRNSFTTAAAQTNQLNNAFTNHQVNSAPDFDYLLMQFTALYDVPALSTASNYTNTTTTSVAAAMQEYKLRRTLSHTQIQNPHKSGSHGHHHGYHSLISNPSNPSSVDFALSTRSAPTTTDSIDGRGMLLRGSNNFPILESKSNGSSGSDSGERSVSL
jgi:hypothetical protein